MSNLAQALQSSPLTESISPLLWSASSSSSTTMRRSNPIAIRRNDSDEEDGDDDDNGVGVAINSFQQLVLSQGAQENEFCVGSLPTSGNTNRRRRIHSQKQQLGTSLPAAPLLRSTRRQTPSIPPIALTEADDGEKEHTSTSPSYGSLRDSQLAKRFLDGPSSYREKSSGEIKQWSRVRFQTPQETQQKQQPSSLAALLSSTTQAQASSSFVDTEQYSLQQQEDVLSTSLTGLELLQRGLSVEEQDRPPDASHLSSWSSSGNNTTSENADDYDIHNNMSPLPDDDEEEEEEEEEDDEDDDVPLFDLDME